MVQVPQQNDWDANLEQQLVRRKAPAVQLVKKFGRVELLVLGAAAAVCTGRVFSKGEEVKGLGWYSV